VFESTYCKLCHFYGGRTKRNIFGEDTEYLIFNLNNMYKTPNNPNDDRGDNNNDRKGGGQQGSSSSSSSSNQGGRNDDTETESGR
jgi:hypothetical protein